MYDVRSELHEFVGSDRSEALSKACGFFGVGEDELEVGAPPASDVMGLGGRVVVVAGLKGRQRPAHSGREDRGDRPERGERRAREGDRDRGRDRGRRGDDAGRDGRGARSARGEREDRPSRGEPEQRSSNEGRPAVASGSSVGTATTPLTRIGEFVQGLVERVDLGGFEIAESAEGDVIAVQLRGEAATRLGEGDARVADAIQLLANQASMREGDNAKRVVVETEGDGGEGRELHLTRLAERAAKRALETGRAVAIDAMSPRDRRVIHVSLRDTADIATMSIGSGRYRQVVVVPSGAPEFEEARRQAEASNRRDE